MNVNFYLNQIFILRNRLVSHWRYSKFTNKSKAYFKCILESEILCIAIDTDKLTDLVDAGQWSTLDRLLEANRRLIFAGQLSGLQGGAQGAAGADGTGGSGWLFGFWTFGWREQDSWREGKIGLKERRKESVMFLNRDKTSGQMKLFLKCLKCSLYQSGWYNVHLT